MSGPDRLNPHSEKKLDGEGKRASETNRLGKAEMGVSMLLPPPYAAPFCEFDPGGGGRANGLGGPCAPALTMGPADGDGGGKTTPGGFASDGILDGVAVLFSGDPCGDESAVALPPSD